MDFPGGSDGNESTCSAGDSGLIPELGRSLEEGDSDPFQCSWLENSMDRGACKESGMTDQLTLSLSVYIHQS